MKNNLQPRDMFLLAITVINSVLFVLTSLRWFLPVGLFG